MRTRNIHQDYAPMLVMRCWCKSRLMTHLFFLLQFSLPHKFCELEALPLTKVVNISAGWCEQLYKTVFEENEVVEGSTSVFPTYMDNESRSYNTPRLYARLTWIHPNFDDFDATLRLPMCKQAALLQWGFMFDMVGLVEKNNKKRRRFKQLSSRYNKTTWVSQISQSGQFLKYFICLFQIIFKNNCFLYAILLTEKE